MLLSTRSLARRRLAATDGVAGRVDQLLFDDTRWTVRHVVVSVGAWLTGRHVLLPPAAIASLDTTTAALAVAHTRAEVWACPDLSTDPPVTYQHQLRALQDRYSCSCTIETGFWAAKGHAGLPDNDSASERTETTGDPHLYGSQDIAGYRVVARDAAVGRVVDLLIDATTWRVRSMAIGLQLWPWGKHVLVMPRDVRLIDWASRTVVIDRWREDVERCAGALR